MPKKPALWGSAFLENLKIRTPKPLAAWAEEHRYIADGSSPEPGKFRCSRTPYIREILDAVTEQTTRELVCCFGIQLGKSEALLSALAYYIQHEPSSILMVEPSKELVVDFGRDRIDGMIYASLELRRLFGVEKSKSKTRATITKDVKRFPGGFLKLASSQSDSDLISRACRVVLLDEIDQYASRHDGNPVDLAIGRASNFVDAKIIMVSSPGTLQSSEIWRRSEGCSQYRYHIPCVDCGQAFEWTWERVRWNEEEPAQCGLYCPACGCQTRGAGPASDLLLAKGHWRCIQEGDSGRKFFHLSSLYSPWVRLDAIVAEFVGATAARDYDRLRAFQQNRLALPWDESKDYGLSERQEKISERRFEVRRMQDHSQIIAITAGVDVQRDRVEIYWYGWAKSKECWFLRYEVVGGDPVSDQCWLGVKDWLAKEYILNDGRKMHIAAACVDSGDGLTTSAVYKFCKRYEKQRVVAVKGKGGNVPAFSAPSRANNFKIPLYTLGVDSLKKTILSRLALETAGAGFIHLTQFCKGEIWAQLHAEVWEESVLNGRKVYHWRKTRERNEALDCLVYAYAAFEIFVAANLKP